MSDLRFACLVPAFNEGPRITNVLSVLVGHPDLDRVLVVDDGSSDDTGIRAREAGADVLVLSRNGGKTSALVAGVMQLDADFIVLIDADLEGLSREAVAQLIAPVRRRRGGVSLSLRGNAPLLWRWIGIDYISGERVLPRALLVPHLASLSELRPFGFEVFLNRVILAGNLPLTVVLWPEVSSPAKARKRGGFWRGLVADMRMLGDIFQTVSPPEALRQILQMCALRKYPGREVQAGEGCDTSVHNEFCVQGTCGIDAFENVDHVARTDAQGIQAGHNF
jgi:glycosyltransferase involved in cell wall biosynthesis